MSAGAQQTAPAPPRIVNYGNGRAIAQRVLVKFKPATDAAGRAQVGGLMAASRLQPIGGAGWYILDSRSFTVANLVRMLRQNPQVADVGPDWVGTVALPRGYSLRPMAAAYRRFQTTAPNSPRAAAVPPAEAKAAPHASQARSGHHHRTVWIAVAAAAEPRCNDCLATP